MNCNSGYCYDFYSEPLGLETQIRINSKELKNPDFIKHVSEQIVSLSQKIWPVIKRNLSYSASYS